MYLSNNNLKEIPVAFFVTFVKLKLLDLRFNALTKIPKEIYKLKCLEILLLDGNQLTTLPVEMGNYWFVVIIIVILLIIS